MLRIRKKTFIYISLSLLIFNVVHGQNNNYEQFLLSSGSKGGNYYRIGNYLSNKLDSIYPNFGFRNIVSTGSLENVNLLDERFSDFAISQRDVLLENIYDEVNGIKNIELILPLFKENFFVYTNVNNDKYKNFSEFANALKSVGVTSKEGYSYRFFKKICKLLGVNSNDIEVIEANYEELSKLYSSGKVDAIISFSLPVKEMENNPTVIKKGFSANEALLVTSKVTNVFLTQDVKKMSGSTVGSWTFLVGLDTSIDRINSTNNEGLSRLLIKAIKNDDNSISATFKNTFSFFENPKNQVLLQGIPLTSSLNDEIGYDIIEGSYFYGIVLIIAFLTIIFLIIKNNIFLQKTSVIWIRYRHIFIGLLCIVLLYFVSVEGLLLSEKEFYKNLGIKSKVLNLTWLDLHFWIIVTNLTGNNNNIFPLSYTGQLMLSFSSYILFIGAILVAFWEFVIYRLNKKRLKGMMSYKYTDHIIIVGWKENSPQFIEELINAKKNFKEAKRNILIVAENPEEIINKSEIVKNYQDTKAINFVSGDIREEGVQKKTNLHHANTIVILSEGISQEADEKTLLRAMAISRYCRKMTLKEGNNKRKGNDISSLVTRVEANKYEDSIYIIAELNNDKYREDLKNADVNEIINAGEYGKNIITQSLLNHGVSKVLDEVLNYNQYNEFYVIDLKEKRYDSLHHKTFDELLPILRKKKILLIAIRVVYHDSNGMEIIDESRLNALLEKEGLKRQIIVNPTEKAEMERPVDNDDQLIVFCTNAKQLKKAF